MIRWWYEGCNAILTTDITDIKYNVLASNTSMKDLPKKSYDTLSMFSTNYIAHYNILV